MPTSTSSLPSWRSHQELSADDIGGHFSSYGEITDLDWLEDGDASFETVRLYFQRPNDLVEALRRGTHHVRRAHGRAHGRIVMAGKPGTGKSSEITIAPPSQEDVGPLVRPSCLEGASVVMMLPQGQIDSVKCFIRKGEWQFNYGLGPLRVVLGVHPLPPFEASVAVFLEVPVVGEVEVAKAGGSLTKGIAFSIGYEAVLKGSVTITMHDQKILVTLDATIWEDHYKKEFVLPFGSQAVSFGVKPTELLMMLSVLVPDIEDLSKFKQTRAIHEQLQSAQQIMTVRTPEEESWCLQRYLVLGDNGTQCQHVHLDLGPFHIQLWWEFAPPFNAGIEVSAQMPWVGKLDLASAEGHLTHGLILDFGCPPYVTGSVTATFKQEGMITIVFKADFLGQEWKR